jgi:hypothetical protein
MKTPSFYSRARIFLFVLLSATAITAFAQSGELYTPKPVHRELTEKKLIERIGFALDLGTQVMNFNDLNACLSERGIGKLNPNMTLASGSLRLNMDRLDAELYALFANAMGDPSVNRLTTYLNFQSRGFGLRLGQALLDTKRFRLAGTLGLNSANFRFTYNAIHTTAPGFSNLLSNPAGSALVRLNSFHNMSVPGGVKLEYKFNQRRPGVQALVGIHTGYNFGVRTGVWQEVGNAVPVADMPLVRPDSYFCNLSVAVLFDR